MSKGGVNVPDPSTSLTVTPAELVVAGRAVRTLLDELSSGFASLDADVQALTWSWKGIQGQRFAAGYEEVRAGLSELLDAMRDTTVALDDSAEAYLEREGANAAAIEAVASSLDLPDVS
ncbi:WXG100 family type VII secretion target [Nocardia farcinica]|uniref:WXG100 family type VII secretion target n=1 Tax=Nocardia farcinica TaxID=37329 RepID=UPI001E2DC101|nr:WXG100 family type VII secretion target [Nocardia farcinica]